jgi:hypothetical protein
MDSIPEPERATKTAARVLFIACVFVALSIFLLNASLAERRALLTKRWERYDAHTRMVERLISFRAKDASLFQDLVTSSFTIESLIQWDEEKYPGLVRRVPLGKGTWGFSPMPEARRERLITAVRSFGEKAAAVFPAGETVADRLPPLRAAVAVAFEGDREAASFISAEIAPKLAALDAPAEWRQIAWWISGGEWPSSGGSHGTGGPGGVTFGVRVTEEPTEGDDQFYAYRLLRFTPVPQSADQELFDLWKQSYFDRHSSATEPSLAIPTFGFSVSADTAVGMAAPILVLLQLMFLMYWERSNSATSSDFAGFAFPSYDCPNDPLDGPFPATPGEMFQRLVWALFLMLPTCLFAVGLLTRYDLHYPLGYFKGSTTTFFAAEMWSRTGDAVSYLMDWMTLICLALSVITILRIARRRFFPPRNFPSERTTAIFAFVVALACAWACVYATRLAFDTVVAPISNASSVPRNMGYLAAFGVVWSVSIGLAIKQRARFLGLISIMGLTVFALHFVPVAHLIRAITSTR